MPTSSPGGACRGSKSPDGHPKLPACCYVESSDRKLGRIEPAATLAVHDIRFRESITIDEVRNYDTEGQVVHVFVEEPITLQPRQAQEVRIPSTDISGGAGASFLVEWAGTPGGPAPLAEAVHVAVSSAAGLSFVTRGTPLVPHVVRDRLPAR